MGENHFAPEPTAVDAVVLLFSGTTYVISQSAIIADQGEGSNRSGSSNKEAEVVRRRHAVSLA